MRPWIPVEVGKTYIGARCGGKRTVTKVVRLKEIMVYYTQDGLSFETIHSVCGDKRFKAWAARNADGSLKTVEGGAK
jgi:hypothetical protein